MRLRLYLGISMLILAGLACSAGGGSEVIIVTSEPTPVFEQPPAEVTPEVGEEQPVDPAPVGGTLNEADCPVAGDGTLLYVDVDKGFCFLYPANYTLSNDFTRPEQAVALDSGPLDDSIEPLAVFMRVESNGPAQVADSAAYANRWQDVYWPDFPDITYQDGFQVGGVDAASLRGIPGRGASARAFIVKDGYKYGIEIVPGQWEAGSEMQALIDALWNTVTGSIVFAQPAMTFDITTPQGVCPNPVDGTGLLVSEKEGYCYLYPSDFDKDPTFAGGVTGREDLGDVEGFTDIRVSFTLAFAGTAQGQTPQQIYDVARNPTIDDDQVTQATIGGAEAVVYRDPRGPWVSRGALIVSEDNFYTIVLQPVDEAQFPEAIPDAERLWDTAVNSLAFFDPYY